MGKKLIFKYGTMNSGKSMFLLTTAYNFQERGVPFICLKSSIDDRDGESIIFSRIVPSRECIAIQTTTDIYRAINEIVCIRETNFEEQLKWILVDEAQFLSEQQVNELANIVDDFNINVMCFGLRTDFQSKLFSGSKRLFELADTIEEIKSTCGCDNKNILNARIGDDDNLIEDGEQIVIGGDDHYVALCRKCFKKLQEKN